jgi:hypothetical protein
MSAHRVPERNQTEWPAADEVEQLHKDLARAKALDDVTPNGVAYEWRLSTWNGSRFVLLREAHHSDADIDSAQAHLNSTFEVVSLRVLGVPASASHEYFCPTH